MDDIIICWEANSGSFGYSFYSCFLSTTTSLGLVATTGGRLTWFKLSSSSSSSDEFSNRPPFFFSFLGSSFVTSFFATTGYFTEATASYFVSSPPLGVSLLITGLVLEVRPNVVWDSKPIPSTLPASKWYSSSSSELSSNRFRFLDGRSIRNDINKQLNL